MIVLLIGLSISFASPQGKSYDAKLWRGGTLDPDVVKVSGQSLRWEHAKSSAITLPFERPQDWSGFSAFSFWMHSQKATDSAFMFIVSSENDKTDGSDYYFLRIKLDWTGWRHFLVPFREMGIARDPVGWHKIDGATFTASGWGNSPNPEAVLHLDGFKVIRMPERKREGPSMSDEEFFKSLDLDMPQLKAVKEAVLKGDYASARRALAEHIRRREWPRWFFDWRDHPFLDVKVPPPEADKNPRGWDYYHLFLTIDWQGWKHFKLKKEDFSPTRNPIGWKWIRYIMSSATGWGLKANPETTLYLDGIRLVGKEGTVTVCDFESESPPFEGIERTDELSKEGKFSGRWADHLINPRIRCWRIPHDWSKFDYLELWIYSEKATGARIVLVLDSDLPKPPRDAEDYVHKRFTWTYGNRPWTVQFKDRIDWAANPTEGEARTHLWNEALNRHFHFQKLAQAYWETGYERYAEALAEQWMDWIRSNPPPLITSGNQAPGGCYAWQTLTTGIRLERTWPDALYRCLGSPAFTDEVIVTIMKSVVDQARHLVKWPTGRNWLTEESMGLFTAGMLFPEFKEAERWRHTAIERLYGQLDEEVYPDGMEDELAAGYNNWVVSNMCNLIERAKMNGFEDEIPIDFKDKLEKMFNYLLYAMMPNGTIPGLNDSGNSDVRELLMRGYKLFPHREDFLFGATLGEKGQKPKYTSYAFPYTGHCVMRSGWKSDAVYLLFDSGPFGSGHQHEDKLHFVLRAYGDQLVLDPGNYSYDRSRWRRYIITTPGHNTIMVDGEGQNRRRRRETWVWPKPWDKPKPPNDDTRWVSKPLFDFVRGRYKSGYGDRNEINVIHTRRVLFVKPDYFVIQDTLVPADRREHTYESLFHLDCEEASLDEGTLKVETRRDKGSNLVIIPLLDGNLKARIVKGQKNPVQGWANHPWRPIPTAIYTKRGDGVIRFLYLLYPLRQGKKDPILSVDPLALRPSDANAIGAVIRFSDGYTDYVLFNDSPGKEIEFAGFVTKAEAMCAREDEKGRIKAKFEAP